MGGFFIINIIIMTDLITPIAWLGAIDILTGRTFAPKDIMSHNATMSMGHC